MKIVLFTGELDETPVTTNDFIKFLALFPDKEFVFIKDGKKCHIGKVFFDRASGKINFILQE